MHIGCAGWTVPSQHAPAFGSEGSHLVRYARRFNAVEINSCFYRPHRRSTYERWAASVPVGFAFAAKLPKEITHVLGLVAAEPALDAFLAQVSGLGPKLGPLLIQLPPKLAFDGRTAQKFFAALRARVGDGSVVCEPRHATWLAAPAEALLTEFKIARAAADPPVGGQRFEVGGWQGLHYYRLHGSPRVYYSAYEAEHLQAVARRLAQRKGAPSWCIFDNTALGAAIANALTLQTLAAPPQRSL